MWLLANLFRGEHTVYPTASVEELTDKRRADLVITEYLKPLYGFALNKTGCLEEAEELAGRIVLEVYSSLLKSHEVMNASGYVFRVAHNVWARHLAEKARDGAVLSIEGENVDPASWDDIVDRLQDAEMQGRLRREIAYLSRVQRQIVVAHYYEGRPLGDISKNLDIPLGTVKWRLFEARKEIRDGMHTIRQVGNLGINPIRFSRMGHGGAAGSKGDTADFLKKTITQNVAYAAYHQPMSINEIAQELGISPVFVEEEVAELAEYGFMEKLNNGKHITVINIDESSEEVLEAAHELYGEYAEMLSQQYCTQVVDMAENLGKVDVYWPENDLNYLLWSLIPYAIMCKLFLPELDTIKQEDLAIPRPDGGKYVAYATLDGKLNLSYEDVFYEFCGDMTRVSERYGIHSWQLDTFWCSRPGSWRDNLHTDYELLYRFLTGALPKDEHHVDSYARLYDKGFLLKRDGGDLPEMVIAGASNMRTNKLTEALPSITPQLSEAAGQLDQRMYDLKRDAVPPHMRRHARAVCQNLLSGARIRTYVLKRLVDDGVLKPPKEHQRKSLTTILLVSADARKLTERWISH